MSDFVPPWMYEQPLCAEVGAGLFFIEDKDENVSGKRLDGYVEAKRICSRCPHLTQCAEWAIKNEDHGYWGGLSPDERKKIRSRSGITLRDSLPSAS